MPTSLQRFKTNINPASVFFTDLTPNPSPKERGDNERVQFGNKCCNITANSYSKHSSVSCPLPFGEGWGRGLHSLWQGDIYKIFFF